MSVLRYGEPEPWFHRIFTIPKALRTKTELFEFFAKELPFPSHATQANWDAFEDALTAFEDSESATLFIVHEDLPLDESNRDTYISILADAVSASHERGGQPWLEVYFSKSDKMTVEEILAAENT